MSALILLLLSLASNEPQKGEECFFRDFTTSEITWNGNGFGDEIADVWPKSHANSSHAKLRRKRSSS